MLELSINFDSRVFPRCPRYGVTISSSKTLPYTQPTDQQRLAIDISPDANPYGWMLDDPDQEDDGEHTRFVYFC